MCGQPAVGQRLWELWVLPLVLVPYLLHPKQLFLYNICDGNKSLETIAL